MEKENCALLKTKLNIKIKANLFIVYSILLNNVFFIKQLDE